MPRSDEGRCGRGLYLQSKLAIRDFSAQTPYVIIARLWHHHQRGEGVQVRTAKSVSRTPHDEAEARIRARRARRPLHNMEPRAELGAAAAEPGGVAEIRRRKRPISRLSSQRTSACGTRGLWRGRQVTGSTSRLRDTEARPAAGLLSAPSASGALGSASAAAVLPASPPAWKAVWVRPVSYTHLTLPTICSV